MHLKAYGEGFQRLTRYWIPIIRGLPAENAGPPDSNALLVKAGFIKRAHASGFFQLLPLGLRVQSKIEQLVDKHMQGLGASKVSLSSLSSEDLWRQSGRFQPGKSGMFSFEDQSGERLLLAPTHEEEMTTLVRDYVHLDTDLPLRLYQVTRKYRDELRPRQGLLRTKEFLMKDLYTFDSTKSAALETYETVRKAYQAFFMDLKIPCLVAEADSGNIGGDLSHEYHIVSAKGEDLVYSCTHCNLSFNEEVLRTKNTTGHQETCPCPQCSRMMTGQTTIELGHTFYLGTKYSKPLNAVVALAEHESDPEAITRPIEMGCHGIGISRLIAAAANHCSDNKGLGWPRTIAPFELAIIQKGPTSGTAAELAAVVTGSTGIDTMLDDRDESLVWKMKDADLVGYPVMAVLGKTWEKEGKVELQCRRLGVKQDVNWEDVPSVVVQLLNKL